MKSARTTYLFLVLLFVAFIGFNLASTSWLKGYRIDLTDNQLYTLSPGSRNILAGLQEPLELTLYFSDKTSKELPSLRSYARRVMELLQEYETLAGDKLKVRVVDPEPFSEAEDAATVAGLQAIPAGIQGQNLYFGLVGRNERGQEEIIPFFQLEKENFLEYELTRLVYSLNRQDLPVVGILSGLNMNGGFDMMRQQNEPAWVIVQQLEDLFEVRWLAEDMDTIDPELNVLMVVHPKKLSDRQQLAIDQFVLSGGKALIFVDPFAETDRPGMPMLSAQHQYSSNLEKLFAAWGLRMIGDRVVGDYSQALVVSVPGSSNPVRHLALLGLHPEAFNMEDVILGGLNAVNFASAGALEQLEGSGSRFESLLLSSPESGLLDAKLMENLQNPSSLYDGFELTSEVYTLAARLSGPARTAFPEGVDGVQPGLTETANINVLVVADTDVLTDRLWVQIQEFFGQRIASPWADNGSFVVNALENLSGSSDLISVRSRGRFSRPFDRVDELHRTAETQLRDSEKALQDRLRETEEKLAALEQAQKNEEGALLTEEQNQALIQFQQEKLRIRKELRDVQHELNRDIEVLGRNLKLINILLVPVLLTLFALIIKMLRSRALRVRRTSP